MSFYAMIDSFIGIFDLNRKLLPLRKIQQKKIGEKILSIRSFRICGKKCDESDLNDCVDLVWQ